MRDAHVMTLGDGRELGWVEFGAPDGWPVLGFHGTPGSRRQLCLDETHAVAAGVRLVAPDRPGYGLSTYQPDRRLVSWPRDVEQLADHLGIGRFSVMGISGGGPHAAACAALVGERVAVAGIVSGAAPLAHPGFADVLTTPERVTAALSRKGSILLRLFVSAEAAAARRFPERALELFRRQLPPPDAEIFERPEMRQLFELEMARMSVTTGKAWAQDLELFSSDWGFDLAAITVPVILWHGEEDRLPLARLVHDAIPGSQLHVIGGQAHLFAIDELESILRELVPEPVKAGARRPTSR